MNREEKRKEAQKQIQEERGFYAHLLTFIFVNIFLVILNYMTSPNSLWFYWPLMGWGLGLAAHAMGVFGPRIVPGKKWEERRMKQLMGEDDE